MQIPCCLDSQIPEKGPVWPASAVSWPSVQGIGAQQGKRDRRRAYDAGPCAHAHINTTQVFGFAGDWVYQGKKCDTHRTQLSWAKAQFHGPAVLGPGLSCVHRWPR